ncbi:MAG TPA: DinB family protein [Ktedonobacteraceae bacterium]|nr:DinB family protein [Ktedonobacteraceae bacterium]
MNTNISGSTTLMTTLADRTALRAQLEETRTAYHALMESLTDADWNQKTRSTAWTVGEVMTHLADTLADKPAAIASVRRGKNFLNLPPALHWLTPRIGYLMVKQSARRQTRQTILARYDQAYSALLATFDGIKDQEWKLGAFCYGEGYKTILEVCQMVVSHFQEHAAQIATRE